MPKYRLLNKEELQSLEKEFIEYLVINGITADEWQQKLTEDKEKADKIVELFSDVVFESILQKAKYLELRSSKLILQYQCLENKIIVVGMDATHSGDNQIDFTNPEYIQKAAKNAPQNIEVFTTEKKYDKERNLYLFELLQKGFTLTDDKLFKAFCLML